MLVCLFVVEKNFKKVLDGHHCVMYTRNTINPLRYITRKTKNILKGLDIELNSDIIKLKERNFFKKIFCPL